MSSLKERNERIGAFSPRGFSTFMTRQRQKKEGGGGIIECAFFMPAFGTHIDLCCWLLWQNPSSNVKGQIILCQSSPARQS